MHTEEYFSAQVWLLRLNRRPGPENATLGKALSINRSAVRDRIYKEYILKLCPSHIPEQNLSVHCLFSIPLSLHP